MEQIILKDNEVEDLFNQIPIQRWKLTKDNIHRSRKTYSFQTEELFLESISLDEGESNEYYFVNFLSSGTDIYAFSQGSARRLHKQLGERYEQHQKSLEIENTFHFLKEIGCSNDLINKVMRGKV